MVAAATANFYPLIASRCRPRPVRAPRGVQAPLTRVTAHPFKANISRTLRADDHQNVANYTILPDRYRFPIDRECNIGTNTDRKRNQASLLRENRHFIRPFDPRRLLVIQFHRRNPDAKKRQQRDDVDPAEQDAPKHVPASSATRVSHHSDYPFHPLCFDATANPAWPCADQHQESVPVHSAPSHRRLV